MAFGRIRRKRRRREKRRAETENPIVNQVPDAFQDESLTPDPLAERQDADRKSLIQQEANRQIQGYQDERTQARGRGREYADEVLSRNYQGFNPQQRQALEESANVRMNRELQGHQQRLAAQHSRRGVRGGAAYAQYADLGRAATDAKQQMQRDLTSMDADLALKKLAAAFNIEQGEAAQSALDRQLAQDEAKYEEEKRRNRYWENQFTRSFNRV